MVGMTSALSSIGLPHWLMLAGAFLVLLGFAGLVLRRKREGENEAIEDEHEPDAIAGEQEILKIEGDPAQAEQTDSAIEQKRRDRRAERELALKEEVDVGPEFYGKRSV